MLEDRELPADTEGFNFRPEDHEEGSSVRDFYRATCGCKVGVNKTACSTARTVLELADFRDNCKQFSSGELDAVVLELKSTPNFQGRIAEPPTNESCGARRRCTSSITKLFFIMLSHYGLFKSKYRHSDISSLVDLSVSVTSSSITGKNNVQLTTDAMGNSLVTWYDWTSFFYQSSFDL